MTYDEYLAKLNQLFNFQHELIEIYKNEIGPYAIDTSMLIKEKDYLKIKDDFNEWISFDNFYDNRKETKLMVINKDKLSIKKTLLIIKNLVDARLCCLICLERIKNNLDKKAQTKQIVKKINNGIEHFKEVYLQLRALTAELNLNYNDDLSNMTFGLNLIDDKSIDLIDFNKILISKEWIKLLNDY